MRFFLWTAREKLKNVKHLLTSEIQQYCTIYGACRFAFQALLLLQLMLLKADTQYNITSERVLDARECNDFAQKQMKEKHGKSSRTERKRFEVLMLLCFETRLFLALVIGIFNIITYCFCNNSSTIFLEPQTIMFLKKKRV